MSSTDARTDANRRNALKSTGPKTPEGKLRSRANALTHGLTGAGVALPGEDAAEVDRRFEALDRELSPDGELARILARRVAVLSVRLERAARYEAAALREAVHNAEGAYDDRRMTEVEKCYDWIAAEPATSVRRMRQTPEGVDRLIQAFRGLAGEIGDPNFPRWDYARWRLFENLTGRRPEEYPASRVDALTRALSGDPNHLPPSETAGLGDEALHTHAREQLIVLVGEELTRLEALRATFDLAAHAADRAGAADRALFDPSPRATLARKYEAAAERGLYRALRELRDCPPGATAEDDDACEALGSFFPEPIPALDPVENAPTDPPAIEPEPPAAASSGPNPLPP